MSRLQSKKKTQEQQEEYTTYKGKKVTLVEYYNAKGIPYRQCRVCSKEYALTTFTSYHPSMPNACDFCISKLRQQESKKRYKEWLARKKQKRK